ncbi:MAG: site-2 protease family protein [Candidatus Heimdallarchaeota archaeon]
MPTEKENNNLDEKPEKKGNPFDDRRISPPSEIQFCWHCGADITTQKEKIYCKKCLAPLEEKTRKEILERTEPLEGGKCWLCKATTSGDFCSVCGAPLTKKAIEHIPKQQTEQKILQPTFRMAIFSPRDREFVPIDFSIDDLKKALTKYLKIKETHNSEAGPVFIIQKPTDPKKTFRKLREDPFLKERNLRTIIRNEQISQDRKEITIRFFYWRPETKKERFSFKSIGWNIALFVATILTVAIAGWQYTKSIFQEYNFTGRTALDVFLYTFSLMLILTVHELGHYTISRLKKLDASLPYFIPVPPLPGFQSLGTFGAMIRQKEPFTTRDDMFDIGIAGPLAGFIVTIPVFLIGLKLTYVIDITEPIDPINIADIPIVLLEEFLIYFGQIAHILPYFDPTTQTVAMHPMMFAGYVGLILTGLNLMPASQLDGGHTSRAIFNAKTHRIISLIFALLLIINPFTTIFGVLILLFSFREHPGAIDDVSKVHWSKYIYLAIAFIIGILCLPLPRIAYFQQLLQR